MIFFYFLLLYLTCNT